MSDTLNEMAEFLGRSAAIIARDLGELQRKLAPRAETLAEAFRHGWREGLREDAAAVPAPASRPPTSETV